MFCIMNYIQYFLNVSLATFIWVAFSAYTYFNYRCRQIDSCLRDSSEMEYGQELQKTMKPQKYQQDNSQPACVELIQQSPLFIDA